MLLCIILQAIDVDTAIAEDSNSQPQEQTDTPKDKESTQGIYFYLS